MPRIVWGEIGKRFYEDGVDRGVLYVGSLAGVPWNGLVSVTEETEGGESRPFYQDGIKYINVSSREQFTATIEAFTYPIEFEICDGTSIPFEGFYITNQKRKEFHLAYRTQIGNDTAGTEHGYKIHLVYNAKAEPTSRENSTIADQVQPNNFSWRITTRPKAVSEFRHTAHFVVDTRYAAPDAVSQIEDILYGTPEENARMVTVEELFEIFTNTATIIVTDNGDGTFSITAPDILVEMISETHWQVTSPTAFYIDEDEYTISSS